MQILFVAWKALDGQCIFITLLKELTRIFVAFSTFNFGFSLEDIVLEMSSVETYFPP